MKVQKVLTLEQTLTLTEQLSKMEMKPHYISKQTLKLNQMLEELLLTNSTTKFNQLKTFLEGADLNRF